MAFSGTLLIMKKTSFMFLLACLHILAGIGAGQSNEPVSIEEAAYAQSVKHSLQGGFLPTCDRPVARGILRCGCSAYFSKMVRVKQSHKVNTYCRNFFGDSIWSVAKLTGCQDYMNGEEVDREKLVGDANRILSNCLSSFSPIELIDF